VTRKRISQISSKGAVTDGITVREAGQRGGRATAERHGEDFFRRIGKKGGNRTAELYRHLLTQFGRRGGRPRRPALGGDLGEGDCKTKGGCGWPRTPSPRGFGNKNDLSVA